MKSGESKHELAFIYATKTLYAYYYKHLTWQFVKEKME